MATTNPSLSAFDLAAAGLRTLLQRLRPADRDEGHRLLEELRRVYLDKQNPPQGEKP
jgi:hypothetical protein